MIWLRQQRLAWASAFRRLLRQPFATFFTTLALGVAISLPTGLYLLMSTLDRLAGEMPALPELSVYLDIDASAVARQQIESGIRAQPEVAEATFIARDVALQKLATEQGLEDVVAGLDSNPLPDTWIVRTHDPEQLTGLKDALAKLPGVDEVVLDSAWIARIAAALALGQTLVVLAGVLFGAALVAVSANAIRAQVLARRDEILVSRLIGASTRYIRRPFVYTGVLQGVLGGLAACVVLAAGAALLGEPLARLATLYDARWSLHAPGVDEIGGLFAATALLGGLGAWIAVGRTLRQVEAGG